VLRHYTLEYWIDDDWYVGRLKEVPRVFSQGENLQELEEHIQDAYHLMIEDQEPPSISPAERYTKEIELKA